MESFYVHPSLNGKEGLSLNLQSVTFKDIVATTGNLDLTIQTNAGIVTVRELLSRDSRPSRGNRHFIPAANPLLVEVSVICNKQLLLKKDEEKNRWGPSIFGYVDRLQDVYRNQIHHPDYAETVFRLGCQKLRLPLMAARVCWLGVGFGQKEGKVSLFGEIEVQALPPEIVKAAKREEGYKLIDLDASGLTQLIRNLQVGEERLRAHCEALIALSLHRRRKVSLKV